MAISWAVRKQFSVLFVIAAVIIAAALLILFSLNNPTCSDGKKNQGEENIDCGGPCEPCVGEIKNLIVHWSKAFKLKDGKYEVVSLVENPNIFAGIPSVKYKFNIYDNKNVLIAVKSGETFINPDEKFLIFEDNLDIGEKTPKYVFLEIDTVAKWKRIENEKFQLVVSQKQFFNTEPFPRLIIKIDNKSLMPAENILLSAVLYDSRQNVIAASASEIDYLPGDSGKETVFTWPEIFSEEPSSIEILFRNDMTKK